MQQSLRQRILDYALAHRNERKWKLRLYAIMYGASLRVLNTIR
jgi:hypothetical protein